LLVSIQRISEVFAVSFARMPIYNRTPGIIAIKELFQMLYDKGEGVLRNFLDNFCKILNYMQNMNETNLI
jgi:hypothetical protein